MKNIMDWRFDLQGLDECRLPWDTYGAVLWEEDHG